MTTADLLREAAERANCKLVLSERVRIRYSAAHAWTSDHAGIDYFVIGIALNRNNEVRVHVSEGWPKNGGMDDVPPDLLESVDRAPEGRDAVLEEAAHAVLYATRVEGKYGWRERTTGELVILIRNLKSSAKETE